MKFLIVLLILIFPLMSVAQIELNNDEFSHPETLVNWHNINDTEGWNITQLADYNIGDTVPGSLFLLPITESWFGEYRGAYLYKEIAGDFVLTTQVSMSARDGISLPASSFSLAGIMIREPLDYPNQDPSVDWAPNEQNYIFMSVGRANQNRLSFEIKNTCNSNSCLTIVDADSSVVTMRMIRRGDEIVVLSQFGNDPWTIQNRFNRNAVQVGDLGSCGQPCNAPFPDTVQIGFVTYTDWEKVSSYTTAFHNSNTLHPDSLLVDPSQGTPFTPDIRSSYDYVRFDSLIIPTDWDTLDMSDSIEVSNIDILNQFSFDSESFCPDNLDVIALPVTDQVIVANAGQSINCGIEISNEVTLSFQAGNEVNFENEFQLVQGASLNVMIDSCPN